MNLARITQYFASVVAVGVCLVASSARAEIAWETSLRKAHAKAKQENKLLLVHFTRDQCVYCDKLEAGAFLNEGVNQTVASHFVPLKVNVSKSANNAKFGSRLEVDRYPMDVIMTTDGTVLSRGVSPQAPQKYVTMLTSTLKQQPSNMAMPPQTAVASHTQDPVDRSPITKRTPSAQLASATMPVSKPAPEPSAPSKSTIGAGEVPQLAMDGFCAVSVIQEKQWVEGKPQHGVIHLGKLYLFADADAKDEFLRDPTPYTPVLNEIDVVRFFEERSIVQGKRKWSVHEPISNRMFFFADEEALEHFEQHYSRYVDSAIDVMDRAIAQSNPN